MPASQDDYIVPPASDEDFRKITAGELKPHNAPITLTEYDPRWSVVCSGSESGDR